MKVQVAEQKQWVFLFKALAGIV